MAKDFENDIFENDIEDDFDEWADFFNEPSNDPKPDENEFVKSFDKEMKKTLAEAAAKIDAEKAKERQRVASLSPEEFWRETCEEKLLELKQKDIKIVDLEKENREYRNKLHDFDKVQATNIFLGCVLGLMLPFVIVGCSEFGSFSFAAESFNVVLAIAVIAALIFSILIYLLILGGAASILIDGLALDRAYREKKYWKIFLAACVFLVFMILFIVRNSSNP